MPSIGELFIQLGVMGNANELKKANQELQKSNILTQKQAKLDKLRAEYLEKIQKAQDKQQKRELAKQYKAKKANIEKETSLKLQVAEGKALRGNIAQWATYAHAVTMAASVAVNALKKINDEMQKVASYGQSMVNIGMGTSAPIPELQKYGRVAQALNANTSEAQVMQQMAKMNQAFELYKSAYNFSDLEQMMDVGRLTQLGAGGLYSDVINKRITNAGDYLEAVRRSIQGQTPENQVNILKAAGLDEALLPMLRMSKEEFDSAANKAQQNALSEQQLQELAEIKNSFAQITQHVSNIYQQVFAKISPVLLELYNAFDKFISAYASKIVDYVNIAVTFWKQLFENYFKPLIKSLPIKEIKEFIVEFLRFSKALIELVAPLVKTIISFISPVIKFILQGINWLLSRLTSILKFFKVPVEEFKLPTLDLPEIDKNATFTDLNRNNINTTNNSKEVNIGTINLNGTDVKDADSFMSKLNDAHRYYVCEA